MSLHVHHVSCGSFCPHTPVHFPTPSLSCHCLVIETDQGLVLVDTGMPRPDFRLRLEWIQDLTSNPKRTEETSMLHRIQELGFQADDVRHIILTHLDWDHAGGMRDFPKATVHVHEREAPYLEGKKSFRRYDKELWNYNVRVESYGHFGDTWNGFKAVRELKGLPPEILLIPLLGHSPGHSGIAVESKAGTLLHAGDAFFFREDLNLLKRNQASDLLQTALAAENAKRVATLFKLARLRPKRPDVTLVNSHDPRLLEDVNGQ